MCDVLQSYWPPRASVSYASDERSYAVFQFTVNDRSFVLQGRLPTSIFQDGIKSAMSRSQGPQTSQTQHTPQQQVLCELSEVYLKGFQVGLMDPRNKEEAGRQFLAKARQRNGEFPRDAKLNEAQRMFRDLSEISDQGFLQAAGWQDLDPKQKADERAMAAATQERQR